MKKGLCAILAALLLAGWLDLLPQRREPEELRLVDTLAVDGAETVTATAVTAVRATGEEEPELFTCSGPDLAAACRALREASSRRAYLGQTEKLLVGEGTDLAALLGYVLSDRDLRLDTLLYIVRGEAGAGLAASLDKVSAETGGEDLRGVTVGKVLAKVSQGEQAAVPALSPGSEGTLAPAGWAVVSDGGIVGWLEGESALGCELLSRVEAERVVSFPDGALRLTGVRIWVKGGILTCVLEGETAQGTPDETELVAWGAGVLRAALAPGWDCWGLAGEQRALDPWGQILAPEELDIRVMGKVADSDGL